MTYLKTFSEMMRLLHIDSFIQEVKQKDSYNVHLSYIEAMKCTDGKEGFIQHQFNYSCEGILIVKFKFLFIAVNHSPCLIFEYITQAIFFELEYLLPGKDLAI